MTSRQQHRFEKRKGQRTVGFYPMHTGRKYRQRLSQRLADSTPQHFKMLPSGGYATYHPTKGWRVVSPKRLRFFPGFVG